MTLHLFIHSKIRHSLLVLLMLCTGQLSFAQSQLASGWAELIGSEDFATSTLGCCVMDAETGEVLFERMQHRSFLTASTMKAVVTRAALEILGAGHRFRTPVVCEGALAAMDGGEWSLQGDLVIVGQGDPTLGSRYFSEAHPADAIVQMLRAKGIQRLEGDLIVDESHFAGPSIAGSTPVEDAGNYYGTGIHAFNYADNTVYLTLKSEAPGSTVEVLEVRPNAAKVGYLCEVQAAIGGGDQAYIHCGPYQTNPVIYGQIPANESAFQIRGAMPHPALEFLHELERRMRVSGIGFEGKLLVRTRQTSAEGEKPQMTDTIGELRSPSLAHIVKVTNRESVNLFASGIFRALDRDLPSDFDDASEALTRWLRSLGVQAQGFFCADGSGLSRLNRATPYQLASVMRTLDEPKLEAAFDDSLEPLSGQPEVFVKSGYLLGVRSYCGRTALSNGRRVSFAVVVNHYDCSPSRARKLIQNWIGYIPKP